MQNVVNMINDLANMFDGVKERSLNTKSLRLCDRIIEELKTFQASHGGIAAFKIAQRTLETARPVFEAWATTGFKSSWIQVKIQLKTAAAGLQALAKDVRREAR
jgi:hypothetical protein